MKHKNIENFIPTPMPLPHTKKYPLHCVLQTLKFSPKLFLPHCCISLIPIPRSTHTPHLISSFLNSANFNLASPSSINSTLFSTPFSFLSSHAFLSSGKPSGYPYPISLTDIPSANFCFFPALFFPSFFIPSSSTLGTSPTFFSSTLPSTIFISSSATFSTLSTTSSSLFQPLGLLPAANISLNFSILLFTSV
ncbi:hypothetical protein L873DRAFT_272054 [Choiromyces venosus 120613-1]|uniref:Uncharacterized protein n=1 Tax=Choiromyces venosus 120613-1 TaxID=1336337 RepID=A0A3N4J023_9PEZI|nr:hypothetical protein L873DRAFT_272054 [Choiromyces venosus 120613-1]